MYLVASNTRYINFFDHVHDRIYLMLLHVQFVGLPSIVFGITFFYFSVLVEWIC